MFAELLIWITTGEGRVYYIYILYVHKLKALILSIVFNYLRFLMMKIDCTKFFFFFLFLACACCCQNRQELYGWYTNSQVTTVALHPGVKNRKGIFAVVCYLSWMHKLNICNSGIVFYLYTSIWVTVYLVFTVWISVKLRLKFDCFLLFEDVQSRKNLSKTGFM